MKIPLIWPAALLAAGTTQVAAQTVTENERQKQLEDCVTLKSDAARLACFDAVMSDDEEIDEEVQKVQVQEARENFGLSEAEIRERRGDDKSEIQVVVNSTVTDTRKEPDGGTTFALANGQVWRTTDLGNMRYDLRRGDKVTLKEGILGGYRATVEGRRGLLGVRRIR